MCTLHINFIGVVEPSNANLSKRFSTCLVCTGAAAGCYTIYLFSYSHCKNRPVYLNRWNIMQTRIRYSNFFRISHDSEKRFLSFENNETNINSIFKEIFIKIELSETFPNTFYAAVISFIKPKYWTSVKIQREI